MKFIKKIYAIIIFNILILSLFACSVNSKYKNSNVNSAFDKAYMFETSPANAVGGLNNKLMYTSNLMDAISEEGGVKKSITIGYNTETKEFDEDIKWINDTVNSFEGIIDNSNINNGNSSNAKSTKSAYFNIRIPYTNLDEFKLKINEKLNVINYNENVDDLTESYYDAEGRKKTLLLQEEKLNEMIKSAETFDDVIKIEEKLIEISNELEMIQKRMDNIDKRVFYATINLSMVEVKDLSHNISINDYSFENIKELFLQNLVKTKNMIIDLFFMFITHLPFIFTFVTFLLVLYLIFVLCASIFKKRKSNIKKILKTKNNKKNNDKNDENDLSEVKSLEEIKKDNAIEKILGDYKKK